MVRGRKTEPGLSPHRLRQARAGEPGAGGPRWGWGSRRGSLGYRGTAAAFWGSGVM